MAISPPKEDPAKLSRSVSSLLASPCCAFFLHGHISAVDLELNQVPAGGSDNHVLPLIVFPHLKLRFSVAGSCRQIRQAFLSFSAEAICCATLQAMTQLGSIYADAPLLLRSRLRTRPNSHCHTELTEDIASGQ